MVIHKFGYKKCVIILLRFGIKINTCLAFFYIRSKLVHFITENKILQIRQLQQIRTNNTKFLSSSLEKAYAQ